MSNPTSFLYSFLFSKRMLRMNTTDSTIRACVAHVIISVDVLTRFWSLIIIIVKKYEHDHVTCNPNHGHQTTLPWAKPGRQDDFTGYCISIELLYFFHEYSLSRYHSSYFSTVKMPLYSSSRRSYRDFFFQKALPDGAPCAHIGNNDYNNNDQVRWRFCKTIYRSPQICLSHTHLCVELWWRCDSPWRT